MRPYLSIDIETTGLDPYNCDIVEFAAVLDDLKAPLETSLKFHCYVTHKQYSGEPYALSMHPTIFRRIATAEEGYNYVPVSRLATEFKRWLTDATTYCGERLSVAGKNFAGFDARFLRRVPKWDLLMNFRHRVIDPGVLFWDIEKDGSTIPDTKTCMQRAGLSGEVAHTALEDAIVVCKLVRTALA